MLSLDFLSVFLCRRTRVRNVAKGKFPPFQRLTVYIRHRLNIFCHFVSFILGVGQTGTYASGKRAVKGVRVCGLIYPCFELHEEIDRQMGSNPGSSCASWSPEDGKMCAWTLEALGSA